MSRLAILRQQLTLRNADALLVTDAKNIFYLSGFLGISPNERESILLVTQTDAFLYVPRMYEGHARHDARPDITVIGQLTKGLLCSFAEQLTENATVLCEAHNMTLAEKSYIEEKTNLTLTPSRKLISSLRLTKDGKEIDSLRKAGAITDKVFSHIQSYIKEHGEAGLYEKDLINEIRRFSESIGSSGFGFDPIVAVGAGAAEPHYMSKNAPLKKGQALLIDMGFVIDGYTSDFTRTMFLGDASNDFKHHYELVRQAQQQCVEAVTPGMKTSELYELSANVFREAGLLDAYLHSLGHGVGLNIHEAPSLSPRSDELLEPGMIITIEPGLYFAGKYGIRIEDLLTVTEDGYELLTQSSRDLIELPLY